MKTYQEASKMPKGGVIKADFDTCQAWAAETIARKFCLQEARVYDWAQRHQIDIVSNGHILTEPPADMLLCLINDTTEFLPELAVPAGKWRPADAGGGIEDWPTTQEQKDRRKMPSLRY